MGVGKIRAKAQEFRCISEREREWGEIDVDEGEGKQNEAFETALKRTRVINLVQPIQKPWRRHWTN